VQNSKTSFAAKQISVPLCSIILAQLVL